MIVVKLSSDSSLEAFEWAKENCPSFEKRTIVSPGGEKIISPPMFITRYDVLCYHFGLEQDAVLFALRWA